MNKKGLTLIEIIIALAILAIISSVFLTSMTTYFDFLSRGRDMTEDVFEGQDTIEENIEIIKAKIFNDEEVTSDTAVEVTYTLFEDEWAEREVKGYLTEVQLPDNNELAAVIGSEQIKYPVPVAENIDLKIRINNVEQPENYEYINKVNLSLRGDFDLSDPDGVHLTNRHEWFVSRLGFNVPIEQDASLIEEQDPGRLYPIFPNDYDLIPIDASTNNFNYSSINTFEEEYTGRHIVYTVTPFATSGKKGETVFSQPVFLHGPTITDNLVLHLDANMISRDTSISNITYDGDIILLDEWEDLTDNNNDAPTFNTAKPILEEVQYQEDAFSWGKSLIQNEDESTIMRVSSFSNNPSDEMTLVFVAKISETNIGSNIMSGNNWSFGWNSSGNLSFKFGGDPATAPSINGIDDKWHVFSCIVSSGNVDFRIDGNIEDTGTTGGSNPCDSDPFLINLDGVDIAEILIYSDDLNSTDLDEVESQIINKYDPDPADIMTNIMYIKSLPARTVIKNETFTPPNPVEAVMTNGTTQNINVTWNNTVDTSVAGTYNISATADIDNTKSVNLVVNVVEIDYLEHHVTPPIIIEKNTEDYNLPTNINAKLTNGNDRIVEVTWTSNEADISVVGGILKGTEVGDYTNAITATANLDSTKSIDYDVKVEKSYLVEFHDYDGTVLKTESVGEGNDAVPPTPDPTRMGYTFTGWDANYTNVMSDLIITAEYDSNDYILTLNDNYSGGSITTKTVTFDEEYGTLRNPSRSEYDFEGWYTETSGGNRIYDSSTVSIPSNHTLYAHWSSSAPSCPFIYAYDGTDYVLEHEAIPFAINNTLETTSYKGLKYLVADEDNHYNIRIAEKLHEISFVNGFNLYAVEYPKNKEIEGVFADIYGNVHTIKNRQYPIEFYDNKGQNKLKEIKEKGILVTSNSDEYNDNHYISKLEAIFDKPDRTEDIAKLIVSVQKTNLTTKLGEYYVNKINSSENMWWIDKILSLPGNKEKFIDFMRVINLQVQVWNGEEWINQGEIKAGRHMLEEFIVPINMDLVKSNQDKVKIRLVSGLGLFEIDQTSIDYSRNEIKYIEELEPINSILNDREDVSKELKSSNDNKRVRMEKGDYIDITYDALEPSPGFTIGYVINVSGHYFMDPDTFIYSSSDILNKDSYKELTESLKDFNRYKIKESLDSIRWLNDLIDDVYNKPLEYKIKRIIVDNYLD